jgi:hypothetical protein
LFKKSTLTLDRCEHRDGFSREDLSRMGVKGKHLKLQGFGSGQACRSLQNMKMPSMNPIKVPDDH